MWLFFSCKSEFCGRWFCDYFEHVLCYCVLGYDVCVGCFPFPLFDVCVWMCDVLVASGVLRYVFDVLCYLFLSCCAVIILFYYIILLCRDAYFDCCYIFMVSYVELFLWCWLALYCPVCLVGGYFNPFVLLQLFPIFVL